MYMSVANPDAEGYVILPVTLQLDLTSESGFTTSAFVYV